MIGTISFYIIAASALVLVVITGMLVAAGDDE